MAPIFFFVFLGITLIWLLLLSYFLWSMTSHYNKLTDGVTTRNLRELLEQILQNTHVARKDIDSLSMRCDTIEKDGVLHIQKIGLLRFNPFKDTGGDQSFILTLLDRSDTGIVISALYSRSGTRWYAKRVRNGKGVEHELSDDEKKAIKSTDRNSV